MTWRESTDRFYWRILPWMAPGLLNSQHVYASELKQAVARSRRWLDLGCGHEFLPTWMEPNERRLDLDGCRAVGIDADTDTLTRHQGLNHRI